jgi:hypothetical protein
MTVTIYHNPNCGASRHVLAMGQAERLWLDQVKPDHDDRGDCLQIILGKSRTI